jgi:vacuolar protein sorting-associated protein 13A/C
MRVVGRLGSLALSDDSKVASMLPEFKQIMSIEGDNFATFCYQTFDTSGGNHAGIKSSFSLTAGSVKFHFLEEPLRDINFFMAKLATLKGLYDAAAQVAVQKASEIERMQFEVSVKSPIVVFPSNPFESLDVLIMRLGEISARNSYEGVLNKVEAGLHGIQLASKVHYDARLCELKMIDDIDINAQATLTSGIDRTSDRVRPDSEVCLPKNNRSQAQSSLLFVDHCPYLRYQMSSHSVPVRPAH